MIWHCNHWVSRASISLVEIQMRFLFSPIIIQIKENGWKIRNILHVIFQTVVLIFTIVHFNSTFQLLYPPAFIRYPLIIWVWKWFKPGKSFLKFGYWSNEAFNKDQTLKMISQVESLPYPDEQGTTEEDRRIQQPKRSITTDNHKDEDNSPKNPAQSIVHQASSQKFIRKNK